MHDNSCYFLAADFDKGQWQEEVNAMSKACQSFEIPHAIEISRSGNGAHLWIFFNEKVPAKEARLLGFGLLDKAMEVYPNLSFDSYDRLFPNQDIMPEGGFGNLIALPLQKETRLSGNSSFVDTDLNAIQDQWHHLAEIKSFSHQDLNNLLTKVSPNSVPFDEQEVIEIRPPWELTAKTVVCSHRCMSINYYTNQTKPSLAYKNTSWNSAITETHHKKQFFLNSFEL